MNFLTLIRRSLRFHARAHLGVIVGAAIGSAALIGALVVGDSVRESLHARALARLGNTEFALAPQGRFFRSALADDWQRLYTGFYHNGAGGVFCAALQLPGTAATPSAETRANGVRVIGVPGSFDQLAQSQCYSSLAADGVLLNEALARQLRAAKGDTVILRVSRPTALSAEAPISPRAGSTVALRLRVAGIAPASALGDFSLLAGQSEPFNAFVPLQTLQQQTGASNQANLLLSSPWQIDLPHRPSSWQRAGRVIRRSLGQPESPNWVGIVTRTGTYDALLCQAPLPVERLNEAFDWKRVWTLADLELNLRVLPEANALEVSTPRIFLDSPVTKAALTPTPEQVGREWAKRSVAGQTNFSKSDQAALLAESLVPAGQGLLTYLANLLRAGTNTTPYSMITAAGPPYVPADLRDDEIVVNQWLADDLHVKPGDTVEVSYFQPESGARLLEATNRFRVHSVVPMQLPWSDRTLMPQFPGIEKAESTHDWDGGFPLVYKIRDQDEAYWKKYRGTPKAFVTLAAGQKLWGNRFGELTAIRFPLSSNTVSSSPGLTPEDYKSAIEKRLLSHLDPAELGFRFMPVRDQALKGAAQGQDFGQLFLGFSFFLVAAALMLMALLFQFGLEQRLVEVGTFLALGFTARQVRRLLLAEAAVLALLGGLVGALAGLGYAKAMLWGLTTIWRAAVGPAALQFHATAATLLIGLCASTMVAVLTIWLTLRKQGRQPVASLLAGSEISNLKFQISNSKFPSSLWLALGAGTGALAIVAWALAKGETANAEAFFGAGALLLVAGLGAAAAWLGRLGRTVQAARLTVPSLAMRSCARRRNRSLATLALLACGAFIIIAIGAFRLDANRDASRRSSGTGGFALLGESTLPVVHDLNTPSGRDAFGLDAQQLAGVQLVPFRVREGDDASCLNLNRAQRPRLLGVNPALLQGRFTFSAVAQGDREAGWDLLHSRRPEPTPTNNQQAASTPGTDPHSPLRTPHSALDEIPAIGDANSIQWALGKKLGDTLDYTDEHGHTFKLRLVGAVANSILQGSLIIDETEFLKKFPGESGYRFFLIDAPSTTATKVSATLSRALSDQGLQVTPAVQRLEALNAVQNTYLGTFQVLGGLGLLLGSAGLGIVVLRNVLERRGELALLLAVGFRQPALHRLVLTEHAILLAAGLGLGSLAAAVAVLPALLVPGTPLPYGTLCLTLAAVLFNGLLWTWAATRYALRGNLLAALRNE